MNDEQQRTQDNLNAVARQVIEERRKKPSQWKKKLLKWGPLGAFIALSIGKLKWVVAGLKFAKFGVLASMLLSIVVYAKMADLGWAVATGLVVLILVHELGHAVAMRHQGISSGPIVFIPFMGAVIAMRDHPRNAWVEAYVGAGGPVLGSLGALACVVVAVVTGSTFWWMLALMGFFINLFNLAPVSPLDGGRMIQILSPKLWIVGALVLGLYYLATFSPLVLLILLFALMNIGRLRERTAGYDDVSTGQRAGMTALYVGLVAALATGTILAQAQTAHIPADVEVFAVAPAALHAMFGLIGSGSWKPYSER